MSKKVEFNFNLHIPYVLKNYKIFDIGKTKNTDYIDIKKTASTLNLFSNISYLETNRILYNLIQIHKKKFKFSLTISGVSIEIMKKYNPKLLKSFKKLIKTGQVELCSSFYYDLQSPISSKEEALIQIENHKQIVIETFGVEPSGFSKTINSFNDFPITCDDFYKKYKSGQNLKLDFNYDDFGIKFEEKLGIFNFLKHLPSTFLKNNFEFILEEKFVDLNFKDLEFKNEMQSSLVSHIFNLEELIKKTQNDDFFKHLKHISTHHMVNNLDLEGFKNNSQNKFSIHENNYDLYVNLRNILEDLKKQVKDYSPSNDGGFSNELPIENLNIIN